MNDLSPDFQSTLQRMDDLSRNHLLYFRLEVGRILLEDLFGGDAEAYLSRDHHKNVRFAEFLRQCGDRMRELGLGEQVLRACLTAYIAVAGLPPEVVRQLVFSQVVELARVEDSATRLVLARATIDNKWSSKQLRDAALAAEQNRWIDAKPEVPGLQPPEVTEVIPAKAPALGHVVSRFERAAEQLDDLSEQWAQVSGKKLSSGQRARMEEALGRLKGKIEALEGILRK